MRVHWSFSQGPDPFWFIFVDTQGGLDLEVEASAVMGFLIYGRNHCTGYCVISWIFLCFDFDFALQNMV